MLEQSQTPPWPGIPKTSSEYVTLIAHYYRAEMGRMSGWRDRIDRTTNWAITVAGAMLSVSLSTPLSHHGVLLFAMVLVLLLLVIESRRYRFFDVYRARVRRLERQYYARIFSPADEGGDTEWMRELSDHLKKPVFLMSRSLAFSRRRGETEYDLRGHRSPVWPAVIGSPHRLERSGNNSRMQEPGPRPLADISRPERAPLMFPKNVREQSLAARRPLMRQQ
jgi:Predicted integral membrane protein (DUF2270)